MNRKLIQKLVHEAKPQISVGLSPQDSVVVVADFERLLTSVVETVYLRSSPKIDEIAERVGRTLIKEVSGTSPETRLEFIQKELIEQKIGRLDRNSWNIAFQWIGKAPNRPSLQTEAKAILEEIEQVYNLLDQKGPSWGKRYGRSLSEASLECRYVLGLSKNCSLRLGRIIKINSERKKTL